MNDETKKKYYQIIVDTWRMFTQYAAAVDPADSYMEIVISKFLEYEQKWKYTPFWQFAGRECSAKLQELEAIWKQKRKGLEDEQNS